MKLELDAFDAVLDVDESLLDAPPAALGRQAAEYERGDRTAFDVSVAFPDGFTGDVMAVIAAIPYGETRTYGDLAAELDTAAVAVGQACGRNPVPLFVPCHRVVGANSLGGYSGDGGTALKRRLLDHERARP